MPLYLQLIFITLLTFFFDAIYLYLNASSFKQMVYDIQQTSIVLRIWPAIVCYAFIVFGIYYFIIREKRSVLDAFFLGIVIYAVYDSTNYATLANYYLSFAILDALWGGILFSLVTFVYQSV